MKRISGFAQPRAPLHSAFSSMHRPFRTYLIPGQLRQHMMDNRRFLLQFRVGFHLAGQFLCASQIEWVEGGYFIIRLNYSLFEWCYTFKDHIQPPTLLHMYT